MMSLEAEVREYLAYLDQLYSFKELAMGVITTPINITHKPLKYMNNMLYYDDGKLTDEYYIKYVVTSPSFKKEGKVYCRGDVSVGDYLTTCKMYGVAMRTPSKDTAFGEVTKVYEPNDTSDIQPQTIIRLVDVNFF